MGLSDFAAFPANSCFLEFRRYGIPQYRKLTGWLQLAGACRILLGFWIPSLQIVSAIGLSVLMLFGVITGILIRDSLSKTFPAFFLLFTQ